MKIRLTTLFFLLTSSFCYSQCLNTDSLSTNNITYSNALACWSPAPIADHYIIHYRELGILTWSNLANITGNDTTRNIPGLSPSTTYEWQIKTYCDTSNQPNSGWSYSDTFTTPAFIPAPFNPIITKTLSSLECNVQTELYIKITQAANEPDIETSTITSDGGYFDINSISFGDSVGYAKLTTTNQSLISVLNAGIIAGQNYAIINSYDSTGSLIGFFSIENANGGIKINSTSPNDGNNYTSGYISEIYFTGLFVNPQNPGPLQFSNDLKSELNDQKYTTDTVQIWCNTTGVVESINPKEIIGIFDILGRERQIKLNAFQIVKFSDGTLEKRIFIKK